VTVTLAILGVIRSTRATGTRHNRTGGRRTGRLAAALLFALITVIFAVRGYVLQTLVPFVRTNSV